MTRRRRAQPKPRQRSPRTREELEGKNKPVPSEKEIPAALRALLTGDDAVDAVWLPPDPILLRSRS